MAKVIQAIRGMHDIPPAETPYWHYVEDAARAVLAAYGYQEIRVPIVESTELFRRSIGEATDIVEKEMYTFTDRNGDSLTLRPECTASCVRAGIELGLLYNQMQRLWSMGPMFRHERPQKGRYRQFHQINVEAFGMPGPELDAELILMTARLWRRLGLSGIELQLNSIGSSETRAAYRERLVAYLSERHDALDEDSRRRLKTNPLRILDSKNPRMQEIIADAPQLLDGLDEDSRQHFETLQEILSAAGIEFSINPRLVRGLDYYCKTVFEWVTDQLGAQGTVCGGGRYDGLVAQIGGRPTAGSGFAIGAERLIELVKGQGIQPAERAPHAYLLAVGQAAILDAHPLAETLRDRLPDLRLVVDGAEGSFKSKLKRADRSGAELALIIGDDELRSGEVTVKHLREAAPQTPIARAALADYLANALDEVV